MTLSHTNMPTMNKEFSVEQRAAKNHPQRHQSQSHQRKNLSPSHHNHHSKHNHAQNDQNSSTPTDLSNTVFAFKGSFSSFFQDEDNQQQRAQNGSSQQHQRSSPTRADSTSPVGSQGSAGNSARGLSSQQQAESSRNDSSALNFSPGSSLKRAASSASTGSSDAMDASTPREGGPFYDNFQNQSGNSGNGAPYSSSPTRNLSSTLPSTPLSPNPHFAGSLSSPARDLSAPFSSGVGSSSGADHTKSPLQRTGLWNEQYSSPQHGAVSSLGSGDHPPPSPSSAVRHLSDQFDALGFGGPPPPNVYDMYRGMHPSSATNYGPRHPTGAPPPSSMHHAPGLQGMQPYFNSHIPHPHQKHSGMMHVNHSHSPYGAGGNNHHYQDRLVNPPARSYSPYGEMSPIGGGNDMGMNSAGAYPHPSAHMHHQLAPPHHPLHHPMPSHHAQAQHHAQGPPQPSYDNRSHKSPNKRNSQSSSSSSSSSSKMMNYSSVQEVQGRIYELAKDQFGCRFLQKKLEERDPEEVEMIFDEVFPHISELMVDPFGNYLCQKLVEHCNDAQKTKIIRAVSNDLVKISTNMHGTRAVQKLIECIGTVKQIKLVTRSLKSHVVSLIKDLNGNHVIQRCLQKLSAKDKQFIYDAVAGRCVEVATHKHGCCVLQRCVDYASPEQKNLLNKEIIHHALSLVQNPFGNYVVQYILDLGDADVNNRVIRKFLGSIYVLSTNKFSSNVIEKCLRISNTVTRQEMVDELASLPSLHTVLQDSYGNYVIQTALTVADPAQFEELARVLKPQLHTIKNTPFGKKIENRLNKQRNSRMRGQHHRSMHHHHNRMAGPPHLSHHMNSGGHPHGPPHPHPSQHHIPPHPSHHHHPPHHPGNHHAPHPSHQHHYRDMSGAMGRRL